MFAQCEKSLDQDDASDGKCAKRVPKRQQQLRRKTQRAQQKILKSLSCLTCGPQIKQKSAQGSLLHFG